mmetsp:Transcript_2270/g.15110  ORF Transcript_2270/g.15110 Transcript_2270/m.15110 type:complete len:121 (-) Transcript_2270:2795-3157(-)
MRMHAARRRREWTRRVVERTKLNGTRRARNANAGLEPRVERRSDRRRAAGRTWIEPRLRGKVKQKRKRIGLRTRRTKDETKQTNRSVRTDAYKRDPREPGPKTRTTPSSPTKGSNWTIWK